MPVVSQALRSVPASTSRLISAGCAQLRPLWPGSIATVLPARGCGASASTAAARKATTLPVVLEPHDFQAEIDSDKQVYGTSPTGITFTLTIGANGFTINDFENPPATLGGEPQRLKPTERQIVRACAAER